MQYRRTLLLAFADLGSHSFRSFLTALGVIFGVGAVVAMMAISEGASREALRAIAAQGIDNIEIRSVRPTQFTAEQTSGSGNTAFAYGVTEADIRHLSGYFDNIRQVVPIKDVRKSIFVNGQSQDVRIMATTPDFLELTGSTMTAGRFLRDSDGDQGLGACVVGAEAARILFRYRDPMERTIRIDGQLFRVIGVLSNDAQRRLADGVHVTRCVFLHIRTADSYFGKTSTREVAGSRESVTVVADFVYAKVKDLDILLNTANRIKTYFAGAHPNNDYSIAVPLELFRQKEAQVARDTVQLVSIAAISLLVGGIGIMNIMLANIFERTKEIGTRRALGAKKSDILLQFLTEAVLLTSIGGVLGVAVGWGITELMVHTGYAQFQPVITMLSIALAAGVSVALGVMFGTYPAWKAANLDPITALRSD